MKTTNYEISKQLAEAGFKTETEFYWAKWNQGEPELIHESQLTPHLIEQVTAYDLETILEALPKSLDQRNGFDIGLRVWWADGANWIGYQNFSGFIIVEDVRENESLADTAARLWLKLKQESLV